MPATILDGTKIAHEIRSEVAAEVKAMAAAERDRPAGNGEEAEFAVGVKIAAGVSLLGEGFAMIDTDAIIGSFARHLMTAFDRWNERGFEAIARDYLERLPGRKAGERRTIDLNGDLLVGPPAGSRPRRTRRTISNRGSCAQGPHEGARLKLGD